MTPQLTSLSTRARGICPSHVAVASGSRMPARRDTKISSTWRAISSAARLGIRPSRKLRLEPSGSRNCSLRRPCLSIVRPFIDHSPPLGCEIGGARMAAVGMHTGVNLRQDITCGPRPPVWIGPAVAPAWKDPRPFLARSQACWLPWTHQPGWAVQTAL